MASPACTGYLHMHTPALWPHKSSKHRSTAPHMVCQAADYIRHSLAHSQALQDLLAGPVEQSLFSRDDITTIFLYLSRSVAAAIHLPCSQSASEIRISRSSPAVPQAIDALALQQQQAMLVVVHLLFSPTCMFAQDRSYGHQDAPASLHLNETYKSAWHTA